jgi:diaminopimelate decarboxylase
VALVGCLRAQTQPGDEPVLLARIPATELADRFGTPLYVYDASVIQRRYAELLESIHYRPLRIHYACKANSNLELLKLVQSLGAGAETVSPGEVDLALRAGFGTAEIIHTCSNMSRQELAYLIELGITVNLDSLTQIRHWGEMAPGTNISIRVNQDIGAGHHAHVVTGGPNSKFGIHVRDLDDALSLAKHYGLRVSGMHQHIGSNILDVATLLKACQALLETAAILPELDFVDLGGGLGIPYRPDELPLDIIALGQGLSQAFDDFCQPHGRPLTLVLEPGRYLVGDAGVLLTSVTDVKRTSGQTFVGVDSGFNHLLRPAMYGAYHPICNASRPQGKREVVTVVGNICESGDVFAHQRALPECREGDLLAILKAGAYGFSMCSEYNCRPRPAEVLVSEGPVRLIRERKLSSP